MKLFLILFFVFSVTGYIWAVPIKDCPSAKCVHNTYVIECCKDGININLCCSSNNKNTNSGGWPSSDSGQSKPTTKQPLESAQVPKTTKVEPPTQNKQKINLKIQGCPGKAKRC